MCLTPFQTLSSTQANWINFWVTLTRQNWFCQSLLWVHFLTAEVKISKRLLCPVKCSLLVSKKQFSFECKSFCKELLVMRALLLEIYDLSKVLTLSIGFHVKSRCLKVSGTPIGFLGPAFSFVVCCGPFGGRVSQTSTELQTKLYELQTWKKSK